MHSYCGLEAPTPVRVADLMAKMALAGSVGHCAQRGSVLDLIMAGASRAPLAELIAGF